MKVLRFQIWSHPWLHIAYQNKFIPLSMAMPPIITRHHLSSASSPAPHWCSYTSAIQTKSAVLIICSYAPESLWTLYFFTRVVSIPPSLAHCWNLLPSFKLSSAMACTVELSPHLIRLNCLGLGLFSSTSLYPYIQYVVLYLFMCIFCL